MRALARGVLPIAWTKEKGAYFAANVPVVCEIVPGVQKNRSLVEPLLRELGEEVEAGARFDVPRLFKAVELGLEEAKAAALLTGLLAWLASERGRVLQLRINKYFWDWAFELEGEIVNKFELAKTVAKQLGLSFGRLCASLYGGFVLADERALGILRRGEMEQLRIVLFERRSASTILEPELELTWEEAERGNFYVAMHCLASICDPQLSFELKRLGCLTVGVTQALQPFGVVREPEGLRKAAKIIGEAPGRCWLLETSNELAGPITEKKRAIKFEDFLKLKGASDYYLL